MMCNTEVDKPFNHVKFYRKFNENKGAVMFNAGYRGGRIFGEVSKLFALFYWVAKFFCEFMMGWQISEKLHKHKLYLHAKCRMSIFLKKYVQKCLLFLNKKFVSKQLFQIIS